MTLLRRHTRPALRSVAALTGAVLVVGLAHVPIQAATAPSAKSAGNAFLGAPTGLSDVDQRGVAQPTAAQVSAAKSLGAAVRWNRYGTRPPSPR